MTQLSWTPALDRLPPVQQLLLREFDATNGAKDLLDRIRTLWPELQRQAEWGFTNHDYVDLAKVDGNNSVDACLFAGVDPFSSLGKCAEIECRVKTSLDIGRSMGLYVDRALIFDDFSSQIFLLDEPNELAIYSLVREALVLNAMRPLLAEGMFEFASPFYGACRSCAAAFKWEVRHLRKSLYDEFQSKIEVELDDDLVTIHSHELLGDNLVHRRELSEYDRFDLSRGVEPTLIARRAMRYEIEALVSGALNTLRFSSRLGATTFSTSRVGLLAARQADGLFSPTERLHEWEATRSAELPWITGLTMNQVVELRSEAGSALPKFRERLLRLSRPVGAETTNSSEELTAELREEALEIENELRSIKFSGRERVRNSVGLAAMTLAVYGHTQEGIPLAAAGAGLLTLLHRLHQSHSKEVERVDDLIAQPGYVLVKAKQLFEHAQ